MLIIAAIKSPNVLTGNKDVGIAAIKSPNVLTGNNGVGIAAIKSPSKITGNADTGIETLDLHVVGHLVFHADGGVLAGEDEAIGEGGIEASMVGFGEPDEVGGTVVGGDTVEMMTIVGMESTERELG